MFGDERSLNQASSHENPTANFHPVLDTDADARVVFIEGGRGGRTRDEMTGDDKTRDEVGGDQGVSRRITQGRVGSLKGYQEPKTVQRTCVSLCEKTQHIVFVKKRPWAVFFCFQI